MAAGVEMDNLIKWVFFYRHFDHFGFVKTGPEISQVSVSASHLIDLCGESRGVSLAGQVYYGLVAIPRLNMPFSS